MLYKEPTPILLPPRKTWEWVKATVAIHGPSLFDYYEEDPTRGGTLWTPAADCTVADTNVPRFFHIPLVLFERIRKEGHPLMPHKILSLVLRHIEKMPPDQAQAVAQAWQLVVQWCVVAVQKDPQSNSLVAFAIEAITKTNNRHFLPVGQEPPGWHNGHTALKFTPSGGATGRDVSAGAGSFCSGIWKRGGPWLAGTRAS
jgi:hypothetical protein